MKILLKYSILSIRNNIKKTILFIIPIILILSFTSCFKKEKNVVLPAAGSLQYATIDMGINYDNQIYFNLFDGKYTSSNYKLFDLAFDCNDSTNTIFLNSAQRMFVCIGNTNAITTADTGLHPVWITDNIATNEIALQLNSNDSNTYIIDRGKSEYSGIDRFKKLKIISISNSVYTIQTCNYDGSQIRTFTIQKNNLYGLIYFSFNNAGTIVNIAPQNNNWDLVFTKYTHVYAEIPEIDPFKYYIVSGCLINNQNKIQATIIKDSMSTYKPFADFIREDALQCIMSDQTDIIGYNWKFYDFNTSLYTIKPNTFYIIKDENGYLYKLRFVDYYNSQGQKGAPSFEYKRL